MKIYKLARAPEQAPDIEYMAAVNVMGAHFAKFRIGSDYWAYRFSFPDQAEKVKWMASKAGSAKALNWAKKHKVEECKVTKDFPAPGSILRCSGD